MPTSFDRIYARVDAQRRQSLQAFRHDQPLQRLQAAGTEWHYVAAGQGEEVILFLHGMAGAYDIWWQQILALQADYRVLSVTNPVVNGLESLALGIKALLEHEGLTQVSLVGTSLGGYLAQYMVGRMPARIKKAVFANTFPPNDLIARRNRVVAQLLPFLPEVLVRRTLGRNVERSIYPASGYSELVRAFLLEQYARPGSKRRFLSGYRCVTTPFEAPDLQASRIPVLILEADNDPLVEEGLRRMLREAYPSARVQTFHQCGHFPYLNAPEAYTEVVAGFLGEV